MTCINASSKAAAPNIMTAQKVYHCGESLWSIQISFQERAFVVDMCCCKIANRLLRIGKSRLRRYIRLSLHAAGRNAVLDRQSSSSRGSWTPSGLSSNTSSDWKKRLDFLSWPNKRRYDRMISWRKPDISISDAHRGRSSSWAAQLRYKSGSRVFKEILTTYQ